MAAAFGLDPVSAAFKSLYQSMYQNNWLAVDTGDYNSLVYPPYPAHHDAVWGPAPNAISPVQTNGLDPMPFETLIASGHAVSFATATGAWSYNPNTGVFEYNPNGDLTINHAIVLVGYDHDKQIFRIKNSWGAWWNGNGFADFTYELFLKTVTGPMYVTALRTPGVDAGGVGALKGFWRAIVDRAPGILVIHHAFEDVGMTGVQTHDAGYFYGQDGSVFPVQLRQWQGRSPQLHVTAERHRPRRAIM